MDIFYSEKKKLAISCLFALLFCILMVVFPQDAIDSGRKSVNLWMTDVLPALLPFFICANFLQNIGIMKYISPCVFPFVMSVLSGYPMGAAVIGNLIRSGELSLDKAKRLLPYCSTSGPAFMIGAVGAGMIGSGQVGMLIALAHYCGAILNGALFYRIFCRRGRIRQRNMRERTAKHVGLSENLTTELTAAHAGSTLQEAVTEAILMSLKSLGIILSYIVIFMFITDILTATDIFSAIEKPWIEAVFKGIPEMTVGCEAAADCIALSVSGKCIICAFLISWGGLSVIGQTMSMLTGTGVTAGYVLAMKLMHGLFSAAVAFVIMSFML